MQNQRSEPLDPRAPTFRRKVNREEHGAVPDECRRWVWAGGRKLKGLVRRREAEVAVYTSPICSTHMNAKVGSHVAPSR